MEAGSILAILFYVLGTVTTYCLYDEATKQSIFNKIWFAIFWPATSLITPVIKLTQWIKKRNNK